MANNQNFDPDELHRLAVTNIAKLQLMAEENERINKRLDQMEQYFRDKFPGDYAPPSNMTGQELLPLPNPVAARGAGPDVA